jgi:hypothetical protein
LRLGQYGEWREVIAAFFLLFISEVYASKPLLGFRQAAAGPGLALWF